MAEIKRVENEVILEGRRSNQAWFEPALGVIPGSDGRAAEVFVRATLLTGNDIGPQFYLRTADLGGRWSDPAVCRNWVKVPLDDDIYEEPWFGLFHHRRTGRLLAIGQTHFVRDRGSDPGQKNEEHTRRPGLKGSIVYSPWDPAAETFLPWKKMALPGDLELGAYYNGQMLEEPDGSILVPGYFHGPLGAGDDPAFKRVTVLRCRFDGRDLGYVEHGDVLSVEEERGLAEPSLFRFKGRCFLTVRHNLRAYAAAGADGLRFGPLSPWRFDDGEPLGNYNTQQHWLAHGDTLWLIYNRRSRLNGGVFRSRAPLFTARVDPEKLCVVRASEKIVLPEKGARMGNFAVANVAPDESWVVTGEWLEGKFPWVKPGSRFRVESGEINFIRYIGDLLLARIRWG